MCKKRCVEYGACYTVESANAILGWTKSSDMAVRNDLELTSMKRNCDDNRSTYWMLWDKNRRSEAPCPTCDEGLKAHINAQGIVRNRISDEQERRNPTSPEQMLADMRAVGFIA